MNDNYLSQRLRAWATFICLVGVLGLIFVQVLFAETASRLESSLFNVLQFVFSLAFTWLLAGSISEAHFRNAQRSFAISAFRRIKEIERSISRLQTHVEPSENLLSDSLKETISIVRAGLASTQDNIRSSIADWSDVIGDEIEVANEVERLANIRDEITTHDAKPAKSSGDDRLNKKLEEINAQISELKDQLPKEIANSILDSDEAEEFGYRDAVKMMQDESSSGRLVFWVYWESQDTLTGDPHNLKVGDKLQIARALTRHRSDVLLAHLDGKSIGVVLNKYGDYECSYENFLLAFRTFADSSLLLDLHESIEAQVTEIDEIEEHDEGKEEKLLTRHFCIEIDTNQFKTISGAA